MLVRKAILCITFSFLLFFICLTADIYYNLGFSPQALANQNITGQWIKSEDIKPGMKLISGDGKILLVSSAWQQRPVNTKTYNLAVKGHHTYFIGQQKIWTHNMADCGDSDGFIKKWWRRLTGRGKKTSEPVKTPGEIAATKAGVDAHYTINTTMENFTVNTRYAYGEREFTVIFKHIRPNSPNIDVAAALEHDMRLTLMRLHNIGVSKGVKINVVFDIKHSLQSKHLGDLFQSVSGFAPTVSGTEVRVIVGDAMSSVFR